MTDLIWHGSNGSERRLQALEDAETIRNLKSRYAALCDDLARLAD